MASTERKRKTGKTKLDPMDLVRTGPETLAGRYMRKFWHPVYRAQDLIAGHAKPIRIMSENFTLYRGEGGTPHVVGFRCPPSWNTTLGRLGGRRLYPMHLPRLVVR